VGAILYKLDKMKVKEKQYQSVVDEDDSISNGGGDENRNGKHMIRFMLWSTSVIDDDKDCDPDREEPSTKINNEQIS